MVITLSSQFMLLYSLVNALSFPFATFYSVVVAPDLIGHSDLLPMGGPSSCFIALNWADEVEIAAPLYNDNAACSGVR